MGEITFFCFRDAKFGFRHANCNFFQVLPIATRGAGGNLASTFQFAWRLTGVSSRCVSLRVRGYEFGTGPTYSILAKVRGRPEVPPFWSLQVLCDFLESLNFTEASLQ